MLYLHAGSPRIVRWPRTTRGRLLLVRTTEPFRPSNSKTPTTSAAINHVQRRDSNSNGCSRWFHEKQPDEMASILRRTCEARYRRGNAACNIDWRSQIGRINRRRMSLLCTRWTKSVRVWAWHRSAGRCTGNIAQADSSPETDRIFWSRRRRKTTLEPCLNISVAGCHYQRLRFAILFQSGEHLKIIYVLYHRLHHSSEKKTRAIWLIGYRMGNRRSTAAIASASGWSKAESFRNIRTRLLWGEPHEPTL